MANTQGKEEVSPEGKVGGRTSQHTQAGPGGMDSKSMEPPPSGPPELIMLREWIRENQTTAMLGAFAVGSLIGYWMKN